MNITDYQFMQSLHVTKLMHKLPNYTMENYGSFREQIQLIDENYPYSMLTWLIILITVLRILMIGAQTSIFFYCKYKSTPNHSKVSYRF